MMTDAMRDGEVARPLQAVGPSLGGPAIRLPLEHSLEDDGS